MCLLLMYMTTHCTRPQISIILLRAYCSSCKHPRQFITNLSAAASKTVRNNRPYNTLSREKCFASVSSHAASVEIYDHLVIFRALFFQLCNVMKFKKMALRLVGYLAERYFFSSENKLTLIQGQTTARFRINEVKFEKKCFLIVF